MNYEEIYSNFEKECYKDDISFDNVLNYNNIRNRGIFLDDIEEGVGGAVDTLIRFYNQEDDAKDIPIEERKPIKIYINSPGGLLTETFIMIDAIKMSKTPVWGIVTGTAYSGGFFTLIACHKRFGYKHSSYLYHEGATGNSGTAAQFENYAAFYKKELGKLKDLVLENTNITEEEYATIKKDDIWYDAEEAIEKGIIDEITEKLI